MPYNSNVIAGNFGSRAKTYDEKAALQQSIAQKLATYIQADDPRRILEIGCGTGFLTQALRDKYPDARIDVTDIAPEMIAFTKAKFVADPLMDFFIMDGEATPNNKDYDLIVTSMTVQWFENPGESLVNLSKIAPVYYATLGPDNFAQWRETLEALSLSYGGRIVKPLPGTFEEEFPKQSYENAKDFLKSVKEIGAHTANTSYKELNAGQLRKAMTHFDNHFDHITWHIVYGSIRPQA